MHSGRAALSAVLHALPPSDYTGRAVGQPLISDAVLQGMYTVAKRLRSTSEAPGFAADLPKAQRALLLKQPVAVLAALLSQLHQCDTVLVAGDARLLRLAAEISFPRGNGPALHALQSPDEECVAVATGMALRIADVTRGAAGTASAQQGTPCPVVVALLSGFPPLPTLLRLIQDRDLPLLLFARGDAEPRAKAERRLLSTGVPILPTDCADAVAVCRVTQECLLRARNGWGGAVIHAAPLPGSLDPLKLLEQHLAKRGLTSL